MEQHDIDARLAQLQSRRQSTPAARPVQRPVVSGKRRHVAHRSRIAATVLSLGAMAGITGAMAFSNSATSSSAFAAGGASVNGTSTKVVSLSLSAATPAAGNAAPQVTTKTAGS
jgi:hypothetical protein